MMVACVAHNQWLGFCYNFVWYQCVHAFTFLKLILLLFLLKIFLKIVYGNNCFISMEKTSLLEPAFVLQGKICLCIYLKYLYPIDLQINETLKKWNCHWLAVPGEHEGGDRKFLEVTSCFEITTAIMIF